MDAFSNLLEDEPILAFILNAALIIAAAFSIFLLIKWVAKFISRKAKEIDHEKGILLKISLPRYPEDAEDTESHPGEKDKATDLAEQLMAELRGIVPDDFRRFFTYNESVSFEILATAKEISFFIFCPKKYRDLISKIVYGTYTDAEITAVRDYLPQITNQRYVGGYIRLIGPTHAPIRTSDTLANDTLNLLLSNMINLKSREMIALQFCVSPVDDKWRSTAHSALQSTVDEPDEGKMVYSKRQGQMLVDRELHQGIENKMSKKGYRVTVRLLCSSDRKDVAMSNFRSVGQTFAQFEMPPITEFETTPRRFYQTSFLRNYRLRMMPFFDPPIYRQTFIANTHELASMFHFPGSKVEVPKIDWQRHKKEPAPVEVPKQGTFLGYNFYRGEKVPVYIQRKDRRRHFYIVGQTGVGKSEYLKNMFLQDVFNGEGACFLDPHGDVAEDILRKVPPERIGDVIYWNPADTEYPMGLNIMDVQTPEEKNIIINSFIALLYKLYDPNRTGIMGPMLERTVRNVMLTAMEEEGNTLIEALRLLTSPDFAKTKIPHIKDPIVKSYWTEQMKRTTDFHKSETLAYYVSKFDRFVTDVTIRNIIGQSESSFNFKEIMDQQKILIINLSKGRIGNENMSFLGMLIIPRILIAAMNRADMQEDARKDFYLYVDEFQNFATQDFVSILSEARKYRLNLVMANQYIAQIREDIRDAVFGNVGSLGVFRVGIEDAEVLSRFTKPQFNEFDLTNNSIGNMYIKLLIDGKPSDPFSVSLDWNEVQAVPSSEEIKNQIIELSRARYARNKHEVSQQIESRAQFHL